MDREIREAERRGDLALASKLRARAGEGPRWKAADGRVLAPHQLGDDHLLNVVKLMARRFVLSGPGKGGLKRFRSDRRLWLLELESRRVDFDLVVYWRARVARRCEECGVARGTPRGPTVRFQCGPREDGSRGV